MKKRHIVTVPMAGRNHNKYAGELDDPHFIPTSPLIERQTLAIWQDAELARACTALVENVKADEKALEAGWYMANQTVTRSKSKHDKHASFTFNASKPPAQEATVPQQESRAVRRRETQGIHPTNDSLEGSQRHGLRRPKAVGGDSEQVALQEIRSKLEVRPKTSAAACIDYAGGDTSSSSNRTTYTTPFTSAGITPGSTNKRFSELVLDLAIDGHVSNTLTQRKDGLQSDIGHSRSWLAEDGRGRDQQDEPTLPTDDVHTGATRSVPQDSSQPNTAFLFPTTSWKESIRNNIKEYIRPGSSHASIRSVAASNTSSRSNLKSQFATIRQRFSRRGSSSSATHRSGRDDGDEYLINASQIQFELLNKPLPPFPGLDTYEEPAKRPRHLADLAIRPKRPEVGVDDAHRIIDEYGDEQVLSAEEVARRREEMSRAVLEKMTTGSIGSGGVTSPANRGSMQIKRNSGNLVGEESHSSGRPDLSRTTTGKTGVGSDKSRPLSLGEVLRDKDGDHHGYYYRPTQLNSRKYPNIAPSNADKFGELRVISVDPTPQTEALQGYSNRRSATHKPYPIDTSKGSTLKSPNKSPFFKRMFGKSKTEKIGA